MKLFANLLGMLGGLIGKTTSGVCKTKKKCQKV